MLKTAQRKHVEHRLQMNQQLSASEVKRLLALDEEIAKVRAGQAPLEEKLRAAEVQRGRLEKKCQSLEAELADVKTCARQAILDSEAVLDSFKLRFLVIRDGLSAAVKELGLPVSALNLEEKAHASQP